MFRLVYKLGVVKPSKKNDRKLRSTQVLRGAVLYHRGSALECIAELKAVPTISTEELRDAMGFAFELNERQIGEALLK